MNSNQFIVSAFFILWLIGMIGLLWLTFDHTHSRSMVDDGDVAFGWVVMIIYLIIMLVIWFA